MDHEYGDDEEEVNGPEVSPLEAMYADHNDAQLAQIFHEQKQRIRELKSGISVRHKVIMAISNILNRRLIERGASAIATPFGTIHTVGRTTARVMDPVAVIEFLAQRDRWKEAIDLKLNATWARHYIEETNEAIPGAELSTTRRLSITTPVKKD